MNRYRVVEDVDSARAAYGATGALFAAAFIIICVMFWHNRAGATPSVDTMDDMSTRSMIYQTSNSSAFPFN
jgi:hypothetical protein